MDKQIKKRILENSDVLKKISGNFNGNHKRTITEIEEVNKHNQEIIDNLKKRQKESRTDRFFKTLAIVLSIIAFFVVVSGAINYNLQGIVKFSVAPNVSTFIGDVRNIDDVNGISRFSETNLNTGDRAIAAFTATNNNTLDLILGITGGGYDFGSELVANQAFLFTEADADFLIGVGNNRGIIFKNDLIGLARVENATNDLLEITSEGNLIMGGTNLIFGFGETIDNIVDGWIRITGNLNVTGDLNITGDLNVEGTFNDVSVKVTKTTDQSIPNNVLTMVNWDSEEYDTDDMHDTVINNSRITFNTAGKYSILAQSEWGINSGGFRFMDIMKNGVDSIARVRDLADNAAEHNIAFVGEFAVGDYIELEVFQDTGGNLDFESGAILENTYLEAHKIN